MPSKKLAVVDDHALVREITSLYLAAQLRAEVFQAGSISELEGLIAKNGPFDLILLDMILPGMDPGLEAVSRVVKLNANQPVVLFSGSGSQSVVLEAIRNGAAGYIDKSQSARSLVNAINFVLAGEVYLPAAFHWTSETSKQKGELTRKELDVLSALAAGLMNKEIAKNLNMGVPTVKMYVRSICSKLGMKNRTQAAMAAPQIVAGAGVVPVAHGSEEPNAKGQPISPSGVEQNPPGGLAPALQRAARRRVTARATGTAAGQP